jgi:hypothetical protein
MSMQTKPSIVFVHGICADGSSFGKAGAVRRGFVHHKQGRLQR